MSWVAVAAAGASVVSGALSSKGGGEGGGQLPPGSGPIAIAPSTVVPLPSLDDLQAEQLVVAGGSPFSLGVSPGFGPPGQQGFSPAAQEQLFLSGANLGQRIFNRPPDTSSPSVAAGTGQQTVLPIPLDLI